MTAEKHNKNLSLDPDITQNRFEPDQVTVGALLGTSLVSAEVQEDFLGRYLGRSGSVAEFWQSLEEDESNDPQIVKELKLTFQLGILCSYHLPLLRQLRGLRVSGELRNLSNLAAFDQRRWRELLEEVGEDGTSLPPNIPGEIPEQRLNHYITTLRESIEALFPSDSLRHALARSFPEDDELVTVLRNAPDLDLYWSNIDAYFRDHEDIPGADREGVVDRVKSLQRLLRTAIFCPPYKA